MKNLLTSISILFVSIASFTQGDDCFNATPLGALPAPSACPLGTGTTFTYNGTTVGATAENPYSSLACMDAPAADVWVTFEASGNEMDLNFTSGLNDANIGIYTGDCTTGLTGLFCESSNNGNINTTLSPFTPGDTYYMQISGINETDFSNFTLDMTNYMNCDLCVLQSNITATPPPTNGYYLPGTTVEFCLNITEYEQVSANWIHAILPSFGSSWDVGSIVPTSSPNASGSYDWIWTDPPGGDPLGWWVDDDPNGPATGDGNPTNNFGDSGVDGNGNWSWCWQITTAVACTPGGDLSMSVNTTADGETGSWTSPACNGDPDVPFQAAMICCDVPIFASTDESCPGAADGTVSVTGQGGVAPYDYVFENSLGNVVFTENNVADGVASTATGLVADTYTVTVTDDTGCEQIVDVVVNAPACPFPTFDPEPADITVQCIGDMPAPFNLTWNDLCMGTGTVASTDGPLVGGPCGGTITRSWTFTNTCGNSVNASQIITINDTQAPVFAPAPANITVECIGDVPAMTNLGYTDNCDGAGVVAGSDGALVGGACGGTITRTWTYTDACGNVATATQTITVQDVTAPVFAAAPANVTVECIGDVPAMTNLNYTDNCDAPGSVAGVDGALVGGACGGTITRTWTYTDACGNVATATQTITVQDVTAPVFAAAPADVTVECIGDVPAMTNLNYTDNCDAPGSVAGVDGALVGGACGGTITRTWTYTDACGNAATATQTITIDDTTPPVLDPAPADVTVECVGDVPAMVNLNYTDNCDAPGSVAGVDGALVGGACGGTITRTWTYTDACGNVATATQTITIDDTTPPVLDPAPADVTVECVGDVPAMVNLNYTDNCDAPGSVAGVDGALVGGACGGTITRTWTYTDACGNAATATQTITIDDTTPPTASNPADINTTGAVPAPDPTVVTDEADNCTANPVVAFVSDVSDGGNCPETITRTYSVTDDCGNTINVIQLIIIGDANLPTASNPANINVECITAVPPADPAVVTDEADDTGVPTVALQSETSDGNTCPETITRVYSVTDDCGNVITVQHDIIVQDVTPPTASNPADINVQCAADVPAADITVVTDEADNCGTPTVAFVSDVSDNNTCPETITRTYSVTDSCGNSINVTQNIIINDTQAPTATAPAAVNVECVTAVPAADPLLITDEADNCTAAPAVIHLSDVSDGNSCPETITRTYRITDDCGNFTDVTQTITINDITLPTASNPAQTIVPGGPAPAPDPTVVIDEADNCGTPTVAFVSQVSDNNPCPETITYTYSVTDSCGNSINVTHEVLITDPIAPTGTPPADVTVDCIDLVPAADPLLITDEADNNGVPTVTHLSDVSDGNTCPEIITRTYRITDPCSNFIDVTQIITVHDLTAPTASNPADINVQCAADVPAADITVVTDEADNCGTPTVAFVSDVSDNNTCPETITRTYSVTDSCGNSINVTQNIIINDTQAPTATAPAAVNVECVTAVPAADPLAITDEADNCTAAPAVIHLSDVSDGNSCPETITRTYRITDDCGNFTDVTQTITINDITLPTASNPAQTIVPGGPAPAPDPTVVIDEADNCGTPTVAFVSQVSDNNPCPETITYTYSVTDSCGNSINVTHEVLITDPIAPTGTPPADVTVDCIDLVPAADPLLITDEADNNGVPTVTHLSDVSDGNTCPETITRTYRITDACANFTDVTQTITVHDLIAPTASNPADINVQCAADVPAADITVVTDEADNCGTPTVAFVSDVSDNNTCPETITRTYSVTDSCGNSINVTQNIIINDTQAPTATAPAAVNVECVTAVPAADPLAITDEADNCTAAPAVIHLSDVSDGNSCPETITRTYRITDDCGNFTDVTQTITINDITLPTASNPAQTIVPGGPAPAPDPTVVIDEADNCGTPTVAFVSQVSDNNPCPETITYTYSVTDSCGNSINVTHEVLITDPIAPTGTAPADVAVECIDLVPAADPLLITDEADNNGVPTVTHLSDVSDGNTCPETITRTYRITDPCGNFIDVVQLITVHDLTAPTASNPAAVNVQCAADVPAADITVVTDEADNCGTPTVAFVSDVSDNNTCPETITRTYSVTDSCGNSINVTQNIIINDTQAPTGTAPAAVNVECIADVPAADPAIITDEADNCTANPTVTHVGDVSDGNTCPETITRTYSITDDCGNQITVDQIITVNDVTNPTASNPAAINVSCASDVPAPDVTVVTDEADNCGTPTVAFVSDVSDNNSCNGEVITRTYSVTDDCGNTINVTQTINIGAMMPVADAGVDQSVCEGTAVTLNGNSPVGANMSWDNGITDGVAFNPAAGTTTYTLTADVCGGECVDTDQVNVTVNPTPIVSFIGDNLVGCAPHVVNFTNTSTEQGNCVWEINGETLNGCGTQTVQFDNSGTYDVTLTVTSVDGCTASDTYSDYVEVIGMPVASFSASNNFLSVENTEVEFSNNSINGDTYFWDFGDNIGSSSEFEPEYEYLPVGGTSYDVTLWAYNSIGCYDSTQITISVEDVLIFYVPNVITPDGDIFNESFKPVFSGGLDIYDYHLTIFNRWGEIIFESFNQEYGWNGHYGDGGLVQDGVYIWQLEFGETMSDKKHTHRGHVTVLK